MSNNSNLETGNTQFRKIPSLQFLYEISENGRVIRNVKSKKQLKQRLTYRGYYIATFCIKGKKIERTIHSLVAECWLGEKPEGYEIDHIDRNKTNNSYKNLRYVTHSENNLNRKITFNVPVRISKDNETIEFRTSKECAEYLCMKTNNAYQTIRWKLTKRRKCIFDYKIEYLSVAQTGRTGSTEHGTVGNRQDYVSGRNSR